MPHPRGQPKAVHPWIDLRAAVFSGLIAGALFCALELLVRALILGDAIWSPLRMIGGILLGRNFAEGNSGGGPLGFIDIALALSTSNGSSKPVAGPQSPSTPSTASRRR